ncbi:MAG: cellulase family glycosylhydrolase [Myxococcota bacterium]
MTWPRTTVLLALSSLAACGDDGAAPSSAADSGTTTTESASTGAPTPVADETGTSTGEPSEPGACAEPIAAHEPETARLQIGERGQFVDALGRSVVMRGINTGGRSKYAPFIPFEVTDATDLDEVRTAADEYFARVIPWGLDTVRMPFSWEALEPTPGTYDLDYLARYEVLLDAAWAHRLRVIVDFHQDVYASPFCGDGFPPWSVPTPDPPEPSHDCRDWFVGYFSGADVRESFDRFWTDADGLQGPFLAMWTTMAEAVGDHPAVVGFEPMNEPGWGTMDDIEAFKADVLEPWYATVAAELQAIAPDVLVFYDGPAAESSGTAGTHLHPAGSGLVYAPHLYDGTLLLGDGWTGIDPSPRVAAMGSFGAEAGVPVLLGEFGYPHATKGGAPWLTLVMDTVDSSRMSATLWEYSTTTELWNAEDLSVTEPDGTDRPILDTYVRPWVRALAGSALDMSWDAQTGAFDVRWTAGEGFTEVMLPARRFGAEPTQIELEGEGACHTWDEARGQLRVTAAAGTSVALHVR